MLSKKIVGEGKGEIRSLVLAYTCYYIQNRQTTRPYYIAHYHVISYNRK